MILAFLGIVARPIDMVVSGINMEGAIAGVPAIAVSLVSYQKAEFAFAPRVAAQVAKQVIEHGLPDQTLLNVNVPALPEDEIAGVMVKRMGLRIYYDELVRRLDPKGRPYYWIGGDEPGGVLEKGRDLWAVAHNYVSARQFSLI